MSFIIDDIAYFQEQRGAITAAGTDLALTKATMLNDVAALRSSFGDRGRAVAELLLARRAGVGKFAAHWIADSDSAQQATPEPVARYRAEKLRAAGVTRAFDVTCSIGTEGHALGAAGLHYVGSDLDAVRVRMARANLGADAHLLRADALVPAVRGLADGDGDVVVADPARRAGGKRITDPAQLLPPLPALLEAWEGSECAIKCAPGIDYSKWGGLVSVVSVAGGVKETCLYSPGLGGAGRREAVVLGAGDPYVISDRDPEITEADSDRPLGTYLIDPDGAIVRAGLVRHYAAREGLWQLDPRIAYLTGDRIPEGTTGFRILDVVPMKKLRAAVSAWDAGALEILVRGIAADPDTVRKKLKLKGATPRALVLTRIGRDGVGIICEARSS